MQCKKNVRVFKSILVFGCATISMEALPYVHVCLFTSDKYAMYLAYCMGFMGLTGKRPMNS